MCLLVHAACSFLSRELANAQHPSVIEPDPLNGFTLTKLIIPRNEIFSGGPPRDGIPTLLNPNFVTAAEAIYLADQDIVIGFEHAGESRAYPLRILNWHELVNDSIAGKNFLVTYCPLCNTGMVFDRDIQGRTHTFGVSGLLYQSDVLMYDHQSESLWSQLKMQAVAGKNSGQKLSWLPSYQMSWKHWRDQNPNTLVLSVRTGFARNYNVNPYDDYANSAEIKFQVSNHNEAIRNKVKVAGIIVNGHPKAYLLSRLPEHFEDIVGNKKIQIIFDKQNQFISIVDEESKPIASVIAYWFAWQAFYPQTEIYQ